MGELELMTEFDMAAAADAETGAGPLPDTIEGEDGSLFERRREESRSSVRLVVLGEDNPTPVFAIELSTYFPRQVELLPHPQWHRLEKRPEAGRREGEVGLEDALELQKRLVVKADVIQVPRIKSGLFQAIRDGVGREGVVVLDASEAFFLGRGHDLAI